MARLAVVIPVYQAEQTLDALAAELVPVLDGLTSDYEVWMVDDGSTDGSWAGIEHLASANARMKGLRLIRNFGEHVAITAGLDRADADHVVIMACDLQDDPAAIPRMLDEARKADLVLVRRLKRRDAWLKRQLARAFYALISLLFHIDYDYRVGNFRLLTRRGLEYFRLHRERMRNVNAIMALMGLRTAYVDVAHRPHHILARPDAERAGSDAAALTAETTQLRIIVAGSSLNSFTFTRNWTASRPSTRRWS